MVVVWLVWLTANWRSPHRCVVLPTAPLPKPLWVHCMAPTPCAARWLEKRVQVCPRDHYPTPFELQSLPCSCTHVPPPRGAEEGEEEEEEEERRRRRIRGLHEVVLLLRIWGCMFWGEIIFLSGCSPKQRGVGVPS